MKILRGFDDYIFSNKEGFDLILEEFNQITSSFSYKTVYLPTVENISIYTNKLGEGTDIVQKEMYKFFNKKGDIEMVLRPEATAGFTRAFLENNWGNLYPLPLKVAYSGSMFRYERPQKGRRREFRQLGIENVNVEKNPYIDFEVITLGYKFLKNIIKTENIPILQLNNLGSPQDRIIYNKELKKFLEKNYVNLSEDSKTRLNDQRYLRILDSKDVTDQEILKQAPKIENFLNKESQNHYEKLKKLLGDNNIKFVHNPLLVRGLDYYEETVFEFQQDNLAFLAGGRYKIGTNYNAIGWAASLERLLLLSNYESSQKSIVLCGDSEESLDFIYSKLIAEDFLKDFSLNFCNKKLSLKQSLQYANKLKANFLYFIGKKELANQEFFIKELF